MERISDIDMYEFKWGQSGVESMIFHKLVGDWYDHAGLEGVVKEGVVGGGKCKWEIMMDICMRWTLVVE